MEFVSSTRAGGVGLVFIVPAVIVAVAQPAQRNAAVILALKSVRGAGVLVWSNRGTELHEARTRERDSRHYLFFHPLFCDLFQCFFFFFLILAGLLFCLVTRLHCNHR